MRKNFYAGMALSLISLLAASCGKNYNATPPPAYDRSQLNTLFADLKPAPQSYAVTAGTSAIVTAANGTVMHFYPNSFKDAAGNIITSGTVNLKVTEMYKTGDMIANRASTIADGKILQSGGQINVTATANGQQVFANKYSVQFLQPTATTTPMNLFYGNTNNANSITTWADGGSATNYGTTATSTVDYGGVEMYIFDSCTSFGWINCDRFYGNDSEKTSVSAIVPDNTFNPSNTQIYLILPDIKSVMSNTYVGPNGEDYNAKTSTFHLISNGNTEIIPIGMNYKFVVITKKDNNNYYYSETSGIITKNLILTAAMIPKTSSEVVTLLHGL